MGEGLYISLTNTCKGSTLTVEGNEIKPGCNSKILLTATSKTIYLKSGDQNTKYVSFPVGSSGAIHCTVHGIDPKNFRFEVSASSEVGGFGPTDNVIIGDDKDR